MHGCLEVGGVPHAPPRRDTALATSAAAGDDRVATAGVRTARSFVHIYGSTDCATASPYGMMPRERNCAGILAHHCLLAVGAVVGALPIRMAASYDMDACFNLPPELLRSPSIAPVDTTEASTRSNWLQSATILQPWGATQFELVANATWLAPLLAERFGFNTIILLPAPAHLSYCAIDGPCGLTAADIATGVDTFRANGWRVILYTSYMHVGEARVWTNGSLNAAHPDWAQRNSSGAPWKFEGANSPLSPCSEEVLNYTTTFAVDQQRAMHGPDATMLDNNEMGPLAWGCASSGCGYEPACADAFNNYVRARFNASMLRDCFGISSSLPIQPPLRSASGTPLYGLWVHWRNFAMASLNCRFHEALSAGSSSGGEQRSQLFANTAIEWSDFSLAQDLQYRTEDAVLSEIYDTDAMLLHFSLSLGVGIAELSRSKTFVAALYQNKMKAVQLSAETLRQVMFSTLAHHARPWLVFESNMLNISNPSAKALQTMHEWSVVEGNVLTDGTLVAPVACMASAATRNFRPENGVAISPKRCLKRAAELGAPARVIFERGYESNNASNWLRGVRLLVLDGVRCLPRGALRDIVGWAAAGGAVLASSDAGQCDGLGRMLPPQRRLSAQLKGLESVTFANISSDAAATLISTESWISDSNDIMQRLVLPYTHALDLQLTIFVLPGVSPVHDASFLLRVPLNGTTAPTARLTAPGISLTGLTARSSGHGVATVHVPSGAHMRSGFAVIVQR